MSKERAIQLRLDGHSLSQIAEILGHRSTGGVLSRWVKGVPPPAWTRRHNAKDDLRAQALELRMRGWTFNRQIAGWWQGLVAAAVTVESRSGMV